MKTLFTLLVSAITICPSNAQDLNIKTESVAIDNLLNFIINYTDESSASYQNRNTTFLIETYADNFNSEDKFILKQCLKVLSQRSNEAHMLSMVLYSTLDGTVLNSVNSSELKRIFHAIEQPKLSIKNVEDDGIETAYSLAKENFNEDVQNTVVMVRMPNRSAEATARNLSESSEMSTKKATTNAVLLTAIALLPELISVIKN